MYKETSKKDPGYNCIAWALGFNHVALWPDRAWVDMLWPRPKPATVTVQEFTEVFALFGFVPSTELFKIGYEKIALYVSPGDVPEHAARQRPDNGQWTAKLGGGIDISQDYLSDFPPYAPYYGGRIYGGATHFYEREVRVGYPSYEDVAGQHGQWPLPPQIARA
jgi:hypothetical protein